MTKKTQKPSKVALIKKALRGNLNMTREEAGAVYGDENMFSRSHFSTIRKGMRDAAAGAAKTTRKAAKTAKKTTQADTLRDRSQTVLEDDDESTLVEVLAEALTTDDKKEIERLQNEITYLRWNLLGECAGFFARWLEEADGQ